MVKNLIMLLAALALPSCKSTGGSRRPSSESAPVAKYGVPRSPLSPFIQLKQPLSGVSQSIGGYSAGCVGGAIELPKSGPGYEVQRLSRNRFFGHPQLVEVIQRAGKAFASRKRLLVGDLGMPAGGPTEGGHASHQSGLDVDMWFYHLGSDVHFTEAMRENLYASSLVDKTWKKLKRGAWDPMFGEEVMWFASQPEVARIFVNAVIKKQLCQDYKDDPRLMKVRPWAFHHEHYHVRLNCPPDSPQCEPQPASTAIECDEASLGYWYSDEKLHQLLHPEKKPPEDVQLPMACKELIGAN